MNSDSPRRRQGQAPLTTGRFSRPNPSDRFSAATATSTTAPAPSRPTDQEEKLETFARSVDCLLPVEGEPSERDQVDLVNLVRSSFPEFLDAKRSLNSAQERQQRQVRNLGPRLLGNAGLILDAPDAPKHLDDTIDDAALIIWKLAMIDEQIEELAREINNLQRRIITSVNRQSPASARAVRHALDRA